MQISLTWLKDFVPFTTKPEVLAKDLTFKTCEVEITFDPPWSKDLMSEEAKLELGML